MQGGGNEGRDKEAKGGERLEKGQDHLFVKTQAAQHLTRFNNFSNTYCILSD